MSENKLGLNEIFDNIIKEGKIIQEKKALELVKMGLKELIKSVDIRCLECKNKGKSPTPKNSIILIIPCSECVQNTHFEIPLD